MGVGWGVDTQRQGSAELRDIWERTTARKGIKVPGAVKCSYFKMLAGAKGKMKQGLMGAKCPMLAGKERAPCEKRGGTAIN